MSALVSAKIPAWTQNLSLTRAPIFQYFSKILLQAFFLCQQADYICFSVSQLKICRFDKRYLQISKSIVLQLCYKTLIGLGGLQISKFFQIFSLNEVFVAKVTGKIAVAKFLRYFGTLNQPRVFILEDAYLRRNMVCFQNKSYHSVQFKITLSKYFGICRLKYYLKISVPARLFETQRQ